MIARYLTREEMQIWRKAWFLGDSNARLVRWSFAEPIKPPQAANDVLRIPSDDHSQKACMRLIDKDYQS